MRKLLFVTMIGLLSVGGCKAAEEVQSKATGLYAKNACGICGGPIKKGVVRSVFYSPLSQEAHCECFAAVQALILDANHCIYEAFPTDSDFTVNFRCRRELARLVQQQVEPSTILEYVQQERGLEMLAELFRNNIQRAIRYAAVSTEKPTLPSLLQLKKKPTA